MPIMLHIYEKLDLTLAEITFKSVT